MPRDRRLESDHSTYTINPKRKAHDVSDDTPAPARKKIQLPARDTTKYPSVNELKRRIRDVKRLLNRVDLPADARIVQERALAGYEKDLADETRRRDRSKMIKKYHFVRFLDRKTATKEVSRLTKQEEDLKESDMDPKRKEKKLAAISSKLHEARVNLNYTIYYPLNVKYISIYAAKKKESTKEGNDDSEEDGGAPLNPESAAERTTMRCVVEKCMKNGTLDLLRDGKLDSSGDVPLPHQQSGDNKTKTRAVQNLSDNNPSKVRERGDKPNVKSRKTEDRKGKNPKHSTPTQVAEEEEESDGGFFEM